MASQSGLQNPTQGCAKISGDPALCCEALGTQGVFGPIRNVTAYCSVLMLLLYRTINCTIFCIVLILTQYFHLHVTFYHVFYPTFLF